MTRTARAVLGAIVFIAAFGWISAAGAQQPERMNVRGTVEKVDGVGMIVKTREGADIVVKFADNLVVRGLVTVPLSEVKPGAYIGVSAMPGSDGVDRPPRKRLPGRHHDRRRRGASAIREAAPVEELPYGKVDPRGRLD